MSDDDRLVDLLAEVKRLAREYRELTGRPLGVTGEVAEYEAARLLGVELAVVRQAGWDAHRQPGNGPPKRLQVKGRCILPHSKPGQRVGRIRLDTEWDAALLVLLDEDYNAFAIHEADRASVEAALLKPGSRAGNERGALSVSKFIAIGDPIWP